MDNTGNNLICSPVFYCVKVMGSSSNWCAVELEKSTEA